MRPFIVKEQAGLVASSSVGWSAGSSTRRSSLGNPAWDGWADRNLEKRVWFRVRRVTLIENEPPWSSVAREALFCGKGSACREYHAGLGGHRGRLSDRRTGCCDAHRRGGCRAGLGHRPPSPWLRSLVPSVVSTPLWPSFICRWTCDPTVRSGPNDLSAACRHRTHRSSRRRGRPNRSPSPTFGG